MAPTVDPNNPSQPVGPYNPNNLWSPPPSTAISMPVTGGNYSGNPTDPTQIAAYVQYLSQQPGADPTLASDPNYWIGKISDTGGLTQGNIGYWGTRSQAGAGNPGGAPGSSTSSGFNFDPNQVASNPGYQFALTQGENALQANKAAQGTLLGSGTAKDIVNYAQGAAYAGEGQLYNQAQNTFQTNFGDLTNLASTGLGATNSAAGYNTGAAAANAAGQVGSANAITGGINGTAGAINNAYLYSQLNPNTTPPPGTAYGTNVATGLPQEAGGGG